MVNIFKLLQQPTQHVDMAQIGPAYWAKFHALAQEFHGVVGDGCSCGQTAEAAMRGLHDAVSVHLGKQPQYPEDLVKLAQFASSAVEMALPRCSPAEAKRLERCIRDVKAKGEGVNPWAVCQASIGCKKPHRLSLAQVLAGDMPGYDVVEATETEEDKRRKEAVRKLFEAALAES